MSQTHTAFALTEEYSGSVQSTGSDGEPIEIPVYQGGVLALPPDGRSYDIAAKLASGDGIIIASTSNAPLVEMLREYPALKEVPVPADRDADDDLDAVSLAMLRDELRAHPGIKVGGGRSTLVERVLAVRESLADGTPPDPDRINQIEGAPA